MSQQDDESGSSLGTTIGLTFILILFLAGSILPLFDSSGGMGNRNLSISDSIVTRQQQQDVVVPGRVVNVGNVKDQLSRAAIQEKLSTIPVFYLATKGGGGNGSGDSTIMASTDIYLSYEEAKEVASSSSSIVKVTSLDQVMYVICVGIALDCYLDISFVGV
jgi:hypothetical protein